MLTPRARIVPNLNVVDQAMDGEILLIHPVNQKIKVLNELGAFIWQKIRQQLDLQAIVAAIVLEYDVSPETAETDTAEFILQLVERDLVRIEETQSE
jgi:hypothetical protein